MKPKWMPTHLGAEPQKVALLGAVVAALVGVIWMNQSPAVAVVAPPSGPAAPQRTAPVAIRPIPSGEIAAPKRRQQGTANGAVVNDFRPTLKLPENVDVSNIDPALHLELLAKTRAGEAAAGGRSLFDFSQAPPPPPPKVAAIKPGPIPVVEQPKTITPAATNVEPVKPPPAPITLKYYGFAGAPNSGQRRAFFLDGEDIFVAGENDVVRGRYRIVRIGVNSAVVEDVPNKNQQTLPLVEELGG